MRERERERERIIVFIFFPGKVRENVVCVSGMMM
jgi:hypothetical protein